MIPIFSSPQSFEVSRTDRCDGKAGLTNVYQVKCVLITEGVIRGGAIPKLETPLGAANAEIEAAQMFDGHPLSTSLLELFSEHDTGTTIETG